MLMLQRFLLHGCLFLLTFELSSWVFVLKLSLMCPVAIMGLFTGQPQMILWAGTHKPIINSKWSPHSISITSPPLCGPTEPVFLMDPERPEGTHTDTKQLNTERPAGAGDPTQILLLRGNGANDN